ncbi:MAG TPA: nuclear transport factor 2 family protein [Chitinophagaceae bacterium]
MKKIFLCFCSAAFLLSCNNEKTEPAAAPEKSTADLPYTASYSSSFTTDVSDADLKMVLTTYKDWADGNMSGLENTLSDSVEVDFSSGDQFAGTKADLMKLWSTYRDSLSSVTIDMHAWQKMYAADKKTGHIVVWYKEVDTYKNGKVDSAMYHDINRVKDGKIVWYSQYKRPLK